MRGQPDRGSFGNVDSLKANSLVAIRGLLLDGDRASTLNRSSAEVYP